MAFDKQKFLSRFIDEAKEHITNLNEGILSLEKNPDDVDTMNAVFRSAHTIKGSSRMMKFLAISTLAHKLEDALDSVRQRRISLSKDLFDLFFKSIETLDQMLDSARSGEDIAEAPSEVCQMLEAAAEGKLIPKQQADAPAIDPKPHPDSDNPNFTESYPIHPSDDSKPEKTIPKEQSEQPSPCSIHKSEEKKTVSDTIRIRSDKLDDLIKLMGEMVSGYSREKYRLASIVDAEITAKQLLDSMMIHNLAFPHPAILKAQSLVSNLKQLSADIKEDMNSKRIILEDLQDISLKMRMLPLSTIFDTFRISVRNLSRSFGKEVELIIEGDETELDKKIIEKIGDPILHMIRNSIDHGIETPSERLKSGKPAAGEIRLSAEYEGGQVLIKISDDGAGIPLEKIKLKALKKKLLRESDLQHISESDLINLIFHPGFSTSDLITDISGRGVGMDVVKENIIDFLKGSIHIDTHAGKGTTFFIRIPMTMAIIHVLIITAGSMMFAIPSNYIEEIVRVPASDIINAVGRKAIRLRNQLISIVPLDKILSLAPDKSKPAQPVSASCLTLIAAAVNDKLGIVIDELLSEEDVVVKPLPTLMKQIPFVSGVVVFDTKRIINVLHIPKIIEAAKEVNVRPDAPAQTPSKKQLRILLVEDSYSTREIEKSILESYGYQVTLAEDGLDGLEKSKHAQFDLVITDIEMPRMNGFLLTETLKKQDNYKDVPVILVTSLDKDEDKKRGIQAGADAYIVKGAFDQTTLIDSVRNLIG